jgi:hypothetical protein
MRRLIFGAMLAIACFGLCTTSSRADLWGINFQGRGINNDANTNAEALGPTDMAGVMAQVNWNNDPTFYGASGLTTHTLNSLMNSTGTSTSLSLTVSANDSWFSGSGSSDPNHKLMDGIVKATASSPATYTFNNLVPGGTYTLIAYNMEDNGRTNNTLTVGNIKYITTAQTGADFTGAFVRAMNTDPNGTRDLGNYVEFDNLTADANGRLVLTDVWDGTPATQNGAGIAGIQLQGPAPVPEPASAVLLGLGTLVLIGIARWRRAN